MSNSSHKAALAAARKTLASPPSSIAVDWMAAALSQMEAPLPHAASHRAIGMINALVGFPTALIGVGVCLVYKVDYYYYYITDLSDIIFSSKL